MLRRSTPSSASLVGGDLSVDILHTEDSVRLGDGTDLFSFADVGGVKTLPVKVLSTTGATDATLTGGTQRTKVTDGVDNVEIDDVGGEKALKVSVIASVGGGGGGTAVTDQAAFTAGATQSTPIGGYYDANDSDDLTDTQIGMVRMTAERALHVYQTNVISGFATSAKQDTAQTALDAIKTAVELLDNTVSGSELQVDIVSSALPSGAATSAKQDTMIGHLATLAGAVSGTEMQVDVLTMPTVAVTGTFWQATQPVSGTFWQATQPVSGTFWQATQPVSLASLPALAAGTNNIGDVDVLSMPTTTVQGGMAHDAAITGQPLPIAGRAKNALPTSVADGDASYIMTDLGGRVVTSLSPRDLVVQATGSQATTTEATMLAAGAAGVFHDITQLILTNSAATAAQVQIRDATAGTIRFEHVIPATSGMVVHFPVPLVQTTAANNWTIDLAGATSTVYYTVQAIKRTA